MHTAGMKLNKETTLPPRMANNYRQRPTWRTLCDANWIESDNSQLHSFVHDLHRRSPLYYNSRALLPVLAVTALEYKATAQDTAQEQHVSTLMRRNDWSQQITCTMK